MHVPLMVAIGAELEAFRPHEKLRHFLQPWGDGGHSGVFAGGCLFRRSYLEAGESIDDFEGFPSVSREHVIAFFEQAQDRLVAS